MSNITPTALLALGVAAALGVSSAAAQERDKKPEPTKAQTEEWLREHIEAWNERPVVVTVKECRILVLDRDRERSEIVDLRGLLLPIEVISLPNSNDATIRLRVKQKHSGTYSMFRACNAQNRFCEEPTGKFQNLPFVDLTVTSVRDFVPGRHTNYDKTARLERALEHYSRLCGAMEDARNRLF